MRNAFGSTEPPLLTEVGELRLTRAGVANPLQLTRSEFQRVGYRLGAEGELLRLRWAALDQPIDGQPVETALLSGIEELEIRFLDGDQRWQETWPPANADDENELPRALEISLRLEDYGDLRWLFATPR